MFKLKIQAQDNGRGNMASRATVTIVISDVNESPQIDNRVFSVNENSPVGETLIDVVTGSDVDAGDILTYSITGGNERDLWGIDSISGQITLVKYGLDYEAQPDHVLTVRATDTGGLYSECAVFIALVDVNDPPELDHQERNIFENSREGTLVGTTIKAKDQDALEVLQYEIVNPNSHELSVGPGDPIYLKSPMQKPGELDLTFNVRTDGDARIVLAASNENEFSQQKRLKIRSVMNKEYCLHHGWPLPNSNLNPADKNGGRRVDLWACSSAYDGSQQWVHDENDHKIRLAKNPSYCLTYGMPIRVS